MIGFLNKSGDKTGVLTKRLDGDIIRTGLNNDLGYDNNDRRENIRRVAEVSKLFADSGFITICSFITPKSEFRKLAKNIIGEENFLSVYLKCSIKTCIVRDVKGHYKKAIKNKITNFTGIDSPFEEPKNYSLKLNTEKETIEKSIKKLLFYLNNKLAFFFQKGF